MLTSGYQRYSLGPFYPPAGSASLSVGVVSGAAGTVNTTGWQCEIDPPSTTPTPWRHGGGTPKVILDQMDVSYPIPGYIRAKLYAKEV